MARKVSALARGNAAYREIESYARCIECGAAAYMADGLLVSHGSFVDERLDDEEWLVAMEDELKAVEEAVEDIRAAMRTGRTSVT